MTLKTLESLGFGGAGLNQDLLKVLAELQGVTISLVTGVGASTQTALANLENEDTIKAIINLTDLAAVDLTHVTINERRAVCTVTLGDSLAGADYVTIRDKRYTFQEITMTPCVNLAPGIVPIVITGGVCDHNTAAAYLAKAIMTRDSLLTATASGAVVTIYVRITGTAGNAYTLTRSIANDTHLAISGATFAGGLAATDCGFKCSDSLDTKKCLVIWFNKQ